MAAAGSGSRANPTLLRRRLAGELRRLRDAAAGEHVGLRVLPVRAGPHGGLAESFRVLGFPDPADPDLVHLEHPTGDAYLASPAQVARYRGLFERAQELALSPAATAGLLLDLRRAG